MNARIASPLLPNSIADICLEIEKRWKQKAAHQKALVIGIAGGSCTGKSSQLSKKISEQLSLSNCILSQDDYQLGFDLPGAMESRYGFDDPSNYGISECYTLIQNLRAGKKARMPIFSFEEKKRWGWKDIPLAQVYILEGLFALHQDFFEQLDYGMYAETPFYGRFLRRLFRNSFERYQADPALVLEKLCQSRVFRAHEELVRQQASRAAMRILLPYRFQESIQAFNLKSLEAENNELREIFSYPIPHHCQLKIVLDPEGNFCVQLWNGHLCYFNIKVKKSIAEQLTQFDWAVH